MKFFIFLIFSVLLLNLSAKTIPFRSGDIYMAETSFYKPDEIENWDQNPFIIDETSPWAGVAVKIHPKRKISIFDYVLEVNGNRYQCVAIRKNNDKFVYTRKEISAEKDAVYTMLFFLSGASLNKNQTASLISPAAGKQNITRFPITNRPSGPPCPYFIIEKQGNFR